MGKGNPDVKNRIVDSAWKLFHEKGYDNTTVDDIIKLSETSKGTYYYYFDSKDALLSTLSDILDHKYEELEAEMDSEGNRFDLLMTLSSRVHAMMEESIDSELIASLYSSQLITKGKRFLLDQNRTYYQLVKKLAEQGQQRGEIIKEVTPEEFSGIYSLCERAVVYEWCLDKASYSLAEYSRKYMPILMEHYRRK